MLQKIEKTIFLLGSLLKGFSVFSNDSQHKEILLENPNFLNFKKICMFVSAMTADDSEFFCIKKSKNGVKIYFEHTKRSTNVISLHINGNNEFYKAISYLLVKCEAHKWNELKDASVGAVLVLDGVSYRVEIKLDNGQEIFSSGRLRAYNLKMFIKCMETIVSMQGSAICDFSSEGKGLTIIDKMVADYKEDL